MLAVRVPVAAVALFTAAAVQSRATAAEAPAALNPGQPGGVSAEICKLEEDTDRAVIAHDREFLTALFADEYQHINFFGSVAGKDAEVTFFTSSEFKLKDAGLTDCATHVYQDVAVATGVNTWTGATYRGRDLSGSYRFTRVYVRRNGSWQVVASHASKISPP